jgi:hypothetical protein
MNQSDMRKLNPDELNAIHTQLKSLHIRYTEVHEEVFDHYHSALEESSEANSNQVLYSLNENFTSDTVKKMEKELLKASKKQVTQMQIESFKFWKYDIKTAIIFLILSLTSILIAAFFSKFILCIWLSIVIIGGLVLMFSRDKALLKINLAPLYKGNTRVINQITFNRSAFLIGVGIPSFIDISYIPLDRIYLADGFFFVSNFFLLAVIIYGLSLYRIFLSPDFKTTPKLQPS